MATTRATVVLPVPEGPTNTKCRIGFSAANPASARIRAASIEAAIARTCRFTGSRPIIASSSASASFTEICGTSSAAARPGAGAVYSSGSW